MIVVDASVLAKCFLPEEGSDAALALLEGPTHLTAPALIRVEVAAAICRPVRAGKLTEDEAKAKCRSWFDLLTTDVIDLIDDQELLADAVHLSATLKHPLQDCLYLEAMRRVGGELVTADRKFHAKVSPIYGDVRLLVGLPSAGLAAN
jgi:predicted nucleic acid-binding protein